MTQKRLLRLAQAELLKRIDTEEKRDKEFLLTNKKHSKISRKHLERYYQEYEEIKEMLMSLE